MIENILQQSFDAVVVNFSQINITDVMHKSGNIDIFSIIAQSCNQWTYRMFNNEAIYMKIISLFFIFSILSSIKDFKLSFKKKSIDIENMKIDIGMTDIYIFKYLALFSLAYLIGIIFYHFAIQYFYIDKHSINEFIKLMISISFTGR